MKVSINYSFEIFWLARTPNQNYLTISGIVVESCQPPLTYKYAGLINLLFTLGQTDEMFTKRFNEHFHKNFSVAHQINAYYIDTMADMRSDEERAPIHDQLNRMKNEVTTAHTLYF